MLLVQNWVRKGKIFETNDVDVGMEISKFWKNHPRNKYLAWKVSWFYMEFSITVLITIYHMWQFIIKTSTANYTITKIQVQFWDRVSDWIWDALLQV